MRQSPSVAIGPVQLLDEDGKPALVSVTMGYWHEDDDFISTQPELEVLVLSFHGGPGFAHAASRARKICSRVPVTTATH